MGTPSKSKVLSEVLEANEQYQKDFGTKGELPLPPARKFAILTCMDARLHPSKYAGLSEGDAHIIRNAGGRASEDAIRSLVISYKLLGTKEFFVIHHTDCGMVLFDNPTISSLLANSLEQAVIDKEGWRDVGQGPGSQEGYKVNWLTFTDDRQAIIDDVSTIRNHPLIPKDIPIYGYLYHVKTGKLEEIEEATKIGSPNNQKVYNDIA